MNKRLQGFVVGVICCALLASVTALAYTGTKNISVAYSNIKVYKDNVLCELKDANGTVVEPFIYKGTTYMPVRGTANLAGMEVTWDGKTQSVYLWDNMVPSGTFLLDVCPPYATKSCETYPLGKSFEMAGKKYSNGLRFYDYSGDALFNLDSRYSTLECTVGHQYNQAKEKTVSFIVDGKLVKEITLEPECLPKKVSIPIQYGLQLKILGSGDVGIGDMTIS